MQQFNQHFVEKILDRIKEIINAVNDNDLALIFNVKPGTISAWRVRNTIDFMKLSALCEEKEWSLDELVLGKTTQYSDKSTFCIENNLRDKKLDDLIDLVFKEKNELINSLKREINTQSEFIESLKTQSSQKSGEQKRKAG
jgi:hypothetical protein